VNSRGASGDLRMSSTTVATNLRIAVPCILVGGVLGAIIGTPLGSPTNGFRAGVILGGAFAFVVLQRKKRRAS
jgi:hypothetical protein